MDVSIIIVSYNTCALLRGCLTSLQTQTHGVGYEILVVDNGSSDDSCAMIETEFPEVNLIRNRENRGFSKANNQAINKSSGACVLLLNSDTVLENNAVGIMYEFMRSHPSTAVCGPLLLNADRTVQRSIDTHPTATSMLLRLMLAAKPNRPWRLLREKYDPGTFDYSKRYQITDGWLTGAVLMIRKEVFADVGLFDEAYHFMLEDTDWGLAVSRSRWETWLVPGAIITHLLGGSRKSLSEEREIFLKTVGVRQQRYYVLKNLGLVRYWLYRSGVLCFYVMNLIRRVFVAAMSSPDERSLAIFKSNLAWQLLLVSVEIGGSKAVVKQP